MPIARRAPKPSADRILAAAETLFAHKGYSGVSLRQLIAASGISTTAFYARFDSKSAVLSTLTEKLFAELHLEAAVTFRNVRGFEEGVDRGIDLLLAQFGPRKALVRLVLSESEPSRTGSESIGSTRRKSYAMLVAFLASRFRALAERGRIEAPHPEALAWALVGALDIQIVRWAVWDEIDLGELRVQLRATTRAILPKERS
jgi:AcrR family transcriptional regulator